MLPARRGLLRVRHVGSAELQEHGHALVAFSGPALFNGSRGNGPECRHSHRPPLAVVDNGPGNERETAEAERGFVRGCTYACMTDAS